MENVYTICPTFDGGRFLIRLVTQEDAADLLEVYSDAEAAPFFNSDNCNGDDFVYKTIERMEQAVNFWIFSYNNGYFVRWAIVDKLTGKAVGTIEAFKREADDHFDRCALVRLDLHSKYEREEIIKEILTPLVSVACDLFGCDFVATKAVSLASERRSALAGLGFRESGEKLIGHDGTEYGDYWETVG